jgi:hypothetical protein
MNNDIIANFSHYVIPNYKEEGTEDQLTYLEKALSTFDKRIYRYIPIGYHYNMETNELRIPRGYPYQDILNSFRFKRKMTVNQKPQEYDKIKLRLFQNPREQLQVEMMSFLCGLGKHAYTAKFSQVFCDLNTGKGKTYCTVASLSYFQDKIVIFIPSKLSKLIDQWYDAFTDYTDKKPRDILIVRGSDMCEDIHKGKYADKEVFIITKGTALSYANTYGWTKFQEMIAQTKAGVKIIDEAHMDMRSNVLIDCYSNVKKNIYLTASALRGNRFENEIFKKIFSGVPIFGKELVKAEENYIIMLMYFFKHMPNVKQRASCKIRTNDGYGLSAVKYSNYLVSKEGARQEFFTAMNKAIRDIFVKYRNNSGFVSLPNIGPGKYIRNSNGNIQINRTEKFQGKLLILGATIEFLKTIRKFLEVNFPEYSIGLYSGEIKDMKIRELELEKDIILATEKGIGTGANIEDLQFMINTIPYSNPVYANQLPGRLRELKGRKVYYMELINTEFSEAAKQYERRSKFLMEKAKSNKLITVSVT